MYPAQPTQMFAPPPQFYSRKAERRAERRMRRAMRRGYVPEPGMMYGGRHSPNMQSQMYGGMGMMMGMGGR